jgi:hypothetical protein
MTNKLHTYLSDHLAGSVAALQEQIEQTELERVGGARTALAGAGDED